MPRLLLASSAPSGPTQEPLAKPGLNSTASITASSMTLAHWSRRSASRPLHDNTTEREQNPHSRHYNGLITGPKSSPPDALDGGAAGRQFVLQPLKPSISTTTPTAHC